MGSVVLRLGSVLIWAVVVGTIVCGEIGKANHSFAVTIQQPGKLSLALDSGAADCVLISCPSNKSATVVPLHDVWNLGKRDIPKMKSEDLSWAYHHGLRAIFNPFYFRNIEGVAFVKPILGDNSVQDCKITCPSLPAIGHNQGNRKPIWAIAGRICSGGSIKNYVCTQLSRGGFFSDLEGIKGVLSRFRVVLLGFVKRGLGDVVGPDHFVALFTGSAGIPHNGDQRQERDYYGHPLTKFPPMKATIPLAAGFVIAGYGWWPFRMGARTWSGFLLGLILTLIGLAIHGYGVGHFLDWKVGR